MKLQSNKTICRFAKLHCFLMQNWNEGIKSLSFVFEIEMVNLPVFGSALTEDRHNSAFLSSLPLRTLREGTSGICH